jgi:pimeloyl-ACP methyl ester carboxylesterase
LWRWDPRSSCWLSGEDVLDTSQVEHAISSEAFEARVAAAIAMRMPPTPPPRPPPATPAVSPIGAPPLPSAPKTEVVPDRWRRGGGLTAPQRTPSPYAGWIPAQAILTCHYSVQSVHYGGFTGGDDALLSRIDRIRHIPCVAVQGGCDMICPPCTALDLHRAWPEMDLRIVTADGHSMYSPGLQAQVLETTDGFRALASAATDSSLPSPGMTGLPAHQPQQRRLPAGASAGVREVQ